MIKAAYCARRYDADRTCFCHPVIATKRYQGFPVADDFVILPQKPQWGHIELEKWADPILLALLAADLMLVYAWEWQTILF